MSFSLKLGWPDSATILGIFSPSSPKKCVFMHFHNIRYISWGTTNSLKVLNSQSRDFLWYFYLKSKHPEFAFIIDIGYPTAITLKLKENLEIRGYFSFC